MSGVKNRQIAFNYFGGKFSFVEELYSFFPPAEDFCHLVDLFMGSLVVSLNYEHGRNIIKTGNDISDQVVNFFRVLRDNEKDLVRLLDLTPCARSEYNQCWEAAECPIENARRFYVRARQSFFGLGVQRQNKGWHMAKTHANCQGGETVSRWKNAIPKLKFVAESLRLNYQITDFDYKTCIEKIDFPKAFFYCDPPYSRRSRASFNDYKHEFTDENHEELSEVLHGIEGLAMVSGYDCSLMNSLYGDWEKRYLTKKKNNIRSGEVQEVVWMNYEPRSDSFPENKHPQIKLF